MCEWYRISLIFSQLGLTNPDDNRDLFYWLWLKILQGQLDKFTEYWNNHKIRAQPDKPNLSGYTPRHAFTVAISLGTTDCRIDVNKDTIDALRNEIPQSREEVMRWVSDDFSSAAQIAYEAIGQPELRILSGWNIFAQMVPLINP